MRAWLGYMLLGFSLSGWAQQTESIESRDSIPPATKVDSTYTSVLSFTEKGQHKSDTLLAKLDSIPAQPLTKADSVIDRLDHPIDSAETLINSTISKLQQRIDSLKAKGQPSEKWETRLDSVKQLSGMPAEKLNKLNSLDEKLKAKLVGKIPGSDSLKASGGKIKDTMGEVNKVSTDLGVGPLGKDLVPQSPAGQLPEMNSNLPNMSLPGMQSNPSVPQVATPSVNGVNLAKPDLGIIGDVKEKTGEIKNITGKASQVTTGAKEYAEDVATIKEEGLSKAEKLPELAEQQANRVEEVAALEKKKAEMTKAMKEQEALIKKYKEEKAIKEDLEKKSKELAGDMAMEKMTKVELPKKMGKYKRKFSQVQDMRHLPKRAPNPMHDLSWRERLVPGLMLHTLSNQQVWLDFSPQAFYKLNGHWSVGIGATYRTSFEPNRIAFNDFGALYGAKVFGQYHAFKGFFARVEVEELNWKPWSHQLTDPNFRESVYAVAMGIGKAYNITKKVKGNVQTLYHQAWNGSDPYKSRILIRFGIDFSIKKREKKPWDDKLKEK